MIDITKFATVSKSSVDSLFGVAGQALEGAEQLAVLNVQTVKTLMAESQENALAILSAKSPAELITLQTSVMQSAPQKALAYGRQVQQIMTNATAGQRAAVEAQVADAQAKFLEAVNGALQNAPGTENILALAKSAVAAANNAYEGVNKASKQVTDAVAANVEKATQVAVKNSRNAVATIDA